VILLVDHQWIFSEPVRDPWIYYGYFLNAPSYLATFRPYYYSARLSVILPGFLVHSLLPSITANVILHLILTGTALLCLYGVARSLFGSKPALLAAICVGADPFFLFSVGQNYVDGFGITYFLLSLLGVTLAMRSRRSLPLLFLAGVAAAALVTANLFYAIYAPFLLAWYFFLRPRPYEASVRTDLAVTASGAGVAFAAFAFISKSSGGSLLYLLSSSKFVGQIAAQGSNPFRIPMPAWLTDAVWLAFPFIVFLTALIVLLRTRSLRDGKPLRAIRAVQIFFTVFALSMLGLQLSPYVAVLQYDFYASLMIPFAGLALAGQIAFLLAGIPRLRSHWLVGLTAVCAVASAAVHIHRADGLPRGVPLLLAVAAGLPLTAALSCRAAGLPIGALAIASLVVSGAAARLAPPTFGSQPGLDKVVLFRQIDAAARAVQKVDPSGNVYFWWNSADDPQRIFDNIAATALSGVRIVNLAFPLILEGGVMADGERMVPHLKIAVLATEPVLSRAEAALSGIGLAARLISTAKIAEGRRPFTITFFEIVRRPTAQNPHAAAANP